MSTLADALRKAASTAGLPEPVATAPRVDETLAQLPDPLDSAWVAMLRESGVEIPASPSMGQLVQRSDALARAHKDAGRRREAEAVTREKDSFLRARAARAWSLVKARFAELDLNEKAYRALKQEDADPERILGRLKGSKGDALRGVGSARLRDALA